MAKAKISSSAEYQREYRKNNPDKVKRYADNFKKKNPDYSKQQYEKRKAKNPNIGKDLYAARKAKNPNIGKDLYAARKEKSKLDITESLKGILNSSKARAKKSGHKHDMTLENFQELFKAQKGRCALTGKKMKTILGSGNDMVSPDRINSNKGYVKGNVQLTLAIANKMKQDLRPNDFYKLCKAVVDYHKS